MDFGSQAVIYPRRGLRFYQVLVILSKLLKAVAFFAAYEVLKKLHTVTFLLILKLCAVVILLPLQKPFSSGQWIKLSEWFQVVKYSAIRVFLDILWVEGLFICGPLRFILLFEHSELLVLAVASTLIYGAPSPSKRRGTIFFLLGIMSIAFFDQDNTLNSTEHPEGVHKSLLIHKIYEFFLNFGLSDHKVGVLILLVAICLDSAFAANSRTLVASLGGAKRLHALSALVSFGLLVPLFLISKLYGVWNISPLEGQTFGSILEDRNGEPASVDANLSMFGSNSSFTMLLWIIYIGTMIVIDFYLTSVVSTRLGVHTVTSLGKLAVTAAAFVLCFTWYSNFLPPTSTPNEPFMDASSPSTLPTHAVSTGVVFAAVAILYATSLLTPSKSGQGPEGGTSGHFIGYSMAGLPLFTPGQTPSHGMALLNNPETMGLGYHVRETLRGIMAEQSSRRIFAFLCVNLMFTFVELLYGVWTNSLGLISDGFHMLFDSAALVVGLYAAVVSHWKPTRVFSYGFHSAEVLSGFVNAVFLIVISGSVFVNALARIHHPPHIHTDRLMAVSIGGLVVNLVGVMALGHAHSHGGGHGHSHGAGGGSADSHGHSHGHNHCAGAHHGHSHGENGLHYGHAHGHKQHKGKHDSHVAEVSSDTNLRGVYLHVLADTLGSVGVIFSSFLVSNYGWNVADPICSVFIACAIGYSAMPLLMDTLRLLTLHAPDPHQPANPKWIVKKVLEFDGVLAVYNPFVWSQTREFTCVSLCVQVDASISEQLILARIKELFHTHCPSIQHLTVQVEKNIVHDHLQAMGVQQYVLLHVPKFGSADNSTLFNSIDNHDIERRTPATLVNSSTVAETTATTKIPLGEL